LIEEYDYPIIKNISHAYVAQAVSKFVTNQSSNYLPFQSSYINNRLKVASQSELAVESPWSHFL
jgi:hypothetical protein